MPLSPHSPQRMGFMPLSASQSNSPGDYDIPLTKISTANSTGARKPNQSYSPTDRATGDGNNEKTGLFHRRSHAGRRKAKDGSPARRGTAGSEVKLNVMGRLYNKVVGFSVVTRYLVYVVPVAIILAIPIIVLAMIGNTGTKQGDNDNDDGNDTFLGNVKDNKGKVTMYGPPLFLLFIWIEVSWCSLWIGKLVSHLLPAVFMFFCGVVSSGTRKYATVLKALEIPLSLFFWALASWLVFKWLIENRGAGFRTNSANWGTEVSWVITIARILGALFSSSAVFLAEKAIVQLISISYHQRSFANRIKDSKREVQLLGLMYDASRSLFPMYCPEFEDEDYIINDSIDVLLAGAKGKGHKRGGSITPMKLIGDVGRFGDKITSVFGNLASEITGKQVFNPNSAHSIVVEALEKTRTSEALAKRIWMSFVVEGKDSLYREDLLEVLGSTHLDDAEECFDFIDADQNGDISLDEMIRKVIEIGKERKAIGNSMKDIGQALMVFDQVLLFVVLLIVIFIFLVWFQSNFLTTVATAGTALLSMSFVFAVTTQEFLGSCIFLFVKHPYDVGDRIDIHSGSEKLQLTVEKISLLYTVFTRIDRMQVVQTPNIQLNNLWIENVTRSKAMKEVIDVSVSYDTTLEDVELLRAEMEKFVRHPDNSRDFQPDLVIGVAGVGDLDKLNLKIAIKHKSNWHNESVRAGRRSKFICALNLALKKVPIYGPGGGGEELGGPTNPSYSVAVSDEIAAAARDKAAKEKEESRLVPTKPAPTGAQAGSDSAEQRAVQDLNTRSPVADAMDDWGVNRDDSTLNSRDASADRNRSTEIDGVRQEMLKRESSRGRRHAGQAVTSMVSVDGAPSVQVTQPTGRPYDEEALSGDPSSSYRASQGDSNAYLSSTQYGGASHPGSASGLSGFPPSGSAHAPEANSGNLSPQSQHSAQFHPLQSAPSHPTGARPRGASTSRPPQGSNNPYNRQY